jgi:hypothetical protein
MGAIVAFGPTFSSFPIGGQMAGKEPQHANFVARLNEQITKTRVVPLAIFQGITGLASTSSRSATRSSSRVPWARGSWN